MISDDKIIMRSPVFGDPLDNNCTIGHLDTKKYISIPYEQYQLINKEFIEEFKSCCDSDSLTFKGFKVNSIKKEVDEMVGKTKELLSRLKSKSQWN